jgi:membrane protein YdbS with pleckstrin-like domain
MGRAKRFGLAALIAFLALNLWTGSPLLALWIGSKVQGDQGASMLAFAVVIVCLAVFSIGLYQALKYVMHSYREATGTLPTVRTHAPWLRSMRGERPDYGGAASVTGAERIIVMTVVLAAVVFEVWFFFFSGSPIG